MARHLFFWRWNALSSNVVGDGDGPPSGRWSARGRAGSSIVFGEADPPLAATCTRHACHHSCRGSRVGCNNTERKYKRDLWESRRKASFPLLSSAQEPTAQRRAINFRSLRRCVKASPAIASAPPIHVLGSGTGAATTVSTMSLPSPPV